MKFSIEAHEKMDAALQLLQGAEISVSNFENIRTLIKGFHPKIDKKLEACSKALATVQKIQSGDVISLTAENLPEESEKQKKRKKALLFFINCIKDLQAEIKRVRSELQNNQNLSTQGKIASWGKIVKFAKGPFGLITIGALIVIGASALLYHGPISSTAKLNTTPTVNMRQKIQVIMYNGKLLPTSQLYVGHGPDCDSPHYHATNGTVVALDGTKVVDPEGCGFGKVSNVQIVTVEK